MPQPRLASGSSSRTQLRQQAIEDAQVSLTEYTNGLLHREIVHGGRITVGDRAKGVVKSSLEARSDIFSVKVWRLDGVLAWTNVEPERIGKKFPMSDHLREVIQSREAVEPRSRSLDSAENAAEARTRRSPSPGGLRPGHRRPLCDRRLGDLRGLVADRGVDRLTRSTSSGSRPSLSSLSSGRLLVLLVRGASSTLRRQTDQLRKRSKDLMAAYAKLEESSLEAIESLNATVEAKDPYTAGHSQRVQRIAVAIGE